MYVKGNNNLKTWSTQDLMAWYDEIVEELQLREDTEKEEFWEAHESVINALGIYRDFLKKYGHGTVIGWIDTKDYLESNIPVHINDVQKWFEETEKNFGPNSEIWSEVWSKGGLR